MKDFWTTFKLGVYVFALPLVATAAASAHQWMTDSKPISVPEITISETVTNGATFSTLRSHTINMDEEGIVRRRLVSINEESNAIGLGGLKVYLARNGEVIKEVYTDSDGSFAVENVETGAYSFIATGESGFAAYGVNVVQGEAKPTVMEVAAVSPKFSAVKEILENRVPEQVAEEIAKLAATESDAIVRNGSNRVEIVDGKLVGSIVPIIGVHKSVAGTYVHIVKGDAEVAKAEVAENGSFEIPSLEPGVYDFVAAGPSGFAAVSFEAVQDEETVLEDTEVIEASIPETSPEPVAQDVVSTYDASSSLDVCLTCPQDNYVVADTVNYACDSCGYVDNYVAPPIEYAGEAIGCGCAAGAACGGCGDFGGYSNCCAGVGGLGGGPLAGALADGVGRFARLGALALGIWAIGEAIDEIDDDDDGLAGDTAGDAPDQSPFQP